MKMTDSRPVNPDIAREIFAMTQSGSHSEAVITRMRALGLNKVESIRLLRDAGGLTLAQAKDLVHLSPAWHDCYAPDEALHDLAEQALHLSEDKRSAA